MTADLRERLQATLGGAYKRAVALLQRAFEQGRPHSVAVHRQMDFESLRGYPPFEALLRPKG